MNMHRVSNKVSVIPVILYKKLNISDRFVFKTPKSNFTNFHPPGRKLFNADGQT